MRRRVFNLVADLSLLAFLATCLLWVRSQFAFDRIVWGSVHRQPHASVDWFNLSTSRSSLDVSWDRNTYAGPDQTIFDPAGTTKLHRLSSPPVSLPLPQEPPSMWNKAGFVFDRFHDVDGDSIVDKIRVAVPYWFPISLTLVFPALWVATRLWHARRIQEGLCIACGYDLRATSERCPECGTPAGKLT